jgi:RHS repeat-associated protein
VNGNTLAYDAENRQSSVTDGVTHGVEKSGMANRGWIILGVRYFGGALGRFVSPDGVGDGLDPVPVPWANFENPQSLNLYAYVRNNPLAIQIPTGMTA